MHALITSAEDFEYANKLMRNYWFDQPYTGRYFDRQRDPAHPDEITERDLVAVSMLGVTIPAPVEIWLLSDEGREQVAELLSPVPVDAEFRVDGRLLDDGGDLYRLWKLLGQASWPNPNPANDMGTTKISKLIAAKRPHLVPIYDSAIRDLLGPVGNYWDAYRHALDDEGMVKFSIAVAEAPAEIPFLRKLDSLLWMFGTEGPRPA